MCKAMGCHAVLLVSVHCAVACMLNIDSDFLTKYCDIWKRTGMKDITSNVVLSFQLTKEWKMKAILCDLLTKAQSMYMKAIGFVVLTLYNYFSFSGKLCNMVMNIEKAVLRIFLFYTKQPMWIHWGLNIW